MKYLASTILLFSISSAYSYDGFKCIPSLKETRLQVLVKEEIIEVRVVNAAGYKFMPQFSGPSTMFDLSFMKMQGEDLSGLGDSFAFSWPRKKCELDSENFVIHCQGPASAQVNGIQSFGISTTEVSERYLGQTFEKRRFRLSVEKDNLYFVNFEFYTQSCNRF